MKLVICEKPSVGAAVAAALGVTGRKDGYIEGNGYLISWCIGHLVQLSEAAAYGEQYKKWSYDSLPILPQEWQYTVAADKGKQFKILKDLMHRADVSEVVNACDAGREGELIFRFVYHQAGCKKPFTRLWISSMENEAIRSGFDNLKDGREYDSFGYVAGWSAGRELAELKSSLETIRSTAAEIINSIDEHIAELQKEQAQDAPREKAAMPEYIYKIEANPRTTGDNDRFFLQAYLPQENGRAKIGDVLYIGSLAKCRELMGGLNAGELTQGEVKELYVWELQSCYSATDILRNNIK